MSSPSLSCSQKQLVSRLNILIRAIAADWVSCACVFSAPSAVPTFSSLIGTSFLRLQPLAIYSHLLGHCLIYVVHVCVVTVALCDSQPLTSDFRWAESNLQSPLPMSFERFPANSDVPTQSVICTLCHADANFHKMMIALSNEAPVYLLSQRLCRICRRFRAN